MVTLTRARRRSAVLTPSGLACLSVLPTINLTAGCLHDCVYCYILGMRLPPQYPEEVVAELRRRQRATASPNEVQQLRRELERWRRLFVLGEIDEGRYRRETSPLKLHLPELEQPREVLDIERAVNYLRQMGKLWADSPPHLQREFVKEVFAQIVVEGPEVSRIAPKPPYAPLFVLDRRERFGGDFCSLAPRAGLEPAT